MNKEQLEQFVQTNNDLRIIADKIISQFVAKEKKVIEEYEGKYGKDVFKTNRFQRFENPFVEGEYIFMFSDKHDDGEMRFDGESVEINGYYETRDYGTDTFQFFLPVDLIEKHDYENYVEVRIDKIVKEKIEKEYQKAKTKVEEEKKKKEEMEKLKKDSEYQLYLNLKKKYENK